MESEAHHLSENPLQGWASLEVRAVSPEEDRHSIHTYFNVCPESPDGRWVVFYRSSTPEAYTGEIVILERATGELRVLAQDVTVEDAHRAACQQWVCNGQEVVFHDWRDGEWQVVAVHIDSLQRRVLARGRQVAWGQPKSDVVPLYAPHYQPGMYRDLELLNVRTGEIKTVLTAEEVRHAYPDAIAEKFGVLAPDQPLSIFFPILSPDLKRVIFKLASPGDGTLRSKHASIRHFLIAYDLEEKRFLFLHKDWGHPAWAADSKMLINTRSVLIDADTGHTVPLPGLPYFPGTHPSISPDGKLFITDTTTLNFGGVAGEWGIVVGDIRGDTYQIIHRFDHSHGATCRRIAHPHPVMTSDGNRIYFNVSTGGWTRLYVMERKR